MKRRCARTRVGVWAVTVICVRVSIVFFSESRPRVHVLVVLVRVGAVDTAHVGLAQADV